MGSSTATPSNPTSPIGGGKNVNNDNTSTNNPNVINRREHFYYGTYPSFPVAEQNQTYFAYFDGVGGTGPEYLGGTAYFVKYLVDEEGNISKPSDTLDPTSLSQAPLYNLNNNFEPGKNAIVKLIEYDPTIAGSATGRALTGRHEIIGVGELYPICVTETGENPDDFLQYSNFGPSTVPITQSILDLNAAWLTSGDIDITSDYFDDWQDVYIPVGGRTFPPDPIAVPNFPSQSVNWTSTSPFFNKIINVSTADANTQIATKLALNIVNNTNNPNYQAQFRVIKNKPTLGTGSIIHISEFFSLDPNPYYPYPYDDPDFAFGSFDNVYVSDSPFFDLEENDVLTFQVKFYRPLNLPPGEIYNDGDIYITDDYTCSFLRIFQQYPVANNGIVNYIGKENQWGWGYFDIVNPPAASGSFANFSLSWDALWIYFSGQIQNYTNQSLNYNQFVIPFGDIKPGDFIRIGYDKNNVYTIIGVFPRYYGLNFMVSPQIPTAVVKNSSNIANTPSPVNNFSINRIVKNGRYIILDVDKPKDGVFFSGIVQPEYTSKLLQENYDKIITDLTERELIN
jgi:hypothetical protein